MASIVRGIIWGTALVAIWYVLGGNTDPEALGMSGLIFLIVAILIWVLF